MKRFYFPGQRPKIGRTIKTSNKNLVVVYKFRTSCMNPFNNAKLAIKVTFNDNVKEPEIKIESNSSIIIYGVKSYETKKSDCSEYYMNSFTVTNNIKNSSMIVISLNDDSEDLYIQLPEKIE